MALTQIKAAALTADLIDETKLADNSIDSEHYNDGSIDNAHLADDAVGVAELSATGTASSSTFLRGDNSWATVTSTTINNNADNRVITGSGTANTLEGESNLTYDGSTLKVNAGLIEIAHTSCHLDFMETSTTNHRLRNGSGNFLIQRISDDKNTTTTQFDIDGGTGAVSLYHEGTKKLSTTADGICFNSDTAAANALDDYEEGTWTPTIGTGSLTSYGTQWYRKVGDLVTCYFYIYNFSEYSNSDNVRIGGLPFAKKSNNESFFSITGSSTPNFDSAAMDLYGRIGQVGDNTIQVLFTRPSAGSIEVTHNMLGNNSSTGNNVHLSTTFSYLAA